MTTILEYANPTITLTNDVVIVLASCVLQATGQDGVIRVVVGRKADKSIVTIRWEEVRTITAPPQ